MKNLKEVRPVLYTKEFAETVAFYSTKLGFECVGGDGDSGWATMQRGEIQILLSLPNEHIPFTKPSFTGSIYLVVEDVDAFWEELKDNAQVCYPIETFDYGMREFALYDNNGYLLQFGEEQ